MPSYSFKTHMLMKRFKYILAVAVAWTAGALSALADTNDMFKVVTEGNVEMTFSVIHEVGDDKPATARVGNATNDPAISYMTEGVVTVPETVTREVDGEVRTYTVITAAFNAFYGCNLVTQVNLPASLKTINPHCFERCTSLETVYLPRGSQLTTINNAAFMDCSSLTTIEIPSLVTTIQEDVFNGCSSLTTVEMPEQLATLGDRAFSSCSSLTRITIPYSVTSLGQNVFAGCTSLTDLYFNITSYQTTVLSSYPLFASLPNESLRIHVNDEIYMAFKHQLPQWSFYEGQLTAADPCEHLFVSDLAKVGDKGLAIVEAVDKTTGEVMCTYAAKVVYISVDGERKAIIYGGPFSPDGPLSENQCWDGYTSWGVHVGSAFTRLSSTGSSNLRLTFPSHVEDSRGDVYTVIGLGAFATWGCSFYGVEEVRIPRTYVYLGNYSLCTLSTLQKYVVIPSSVKQLGSPLNSSASQIFSQESIDNEDYRVRNVYFLHRDADVHWYDYFTCQYFRSRNYDNRYVYLRVCQDIVDTYCGDDVTGSGFKYWTKYLMTGDTKTSHQRMATWSPSSLAYIDGRVRKHYELGDYVTQVYNDMFRLPITAEHFSSTDESVVEITGAGTASNGDIAVYYRVKKAGEATIVFHYPGDDVFDELTSSEKIVSLYGVFTATADGYSVPFKILTEDADGGTVQLGERDYDNTEPLDTDIPDVFSGSSCPSYFSIPETVEHNGKTYTVTAIGAYALSQFSGEEIELPSTITDIGYHAFNNSCSLQTLYVDSTTPPNLVVGAADDEDPSPFDSSLAESCTLYVPRGCEDAYSSWSEYFMSTSTPPEMVVVDGVEITEETDLYGDGTAVLTWEYEGAGGDDVIKAPSKVKRSADDGRVPVLTLNGATITSADGPAIEVNTYPRFYIRVASGQNTIATTNGQAAIAIGTSKGQNLSSTSLVILNEDGLSGGGVAPKAPSRSTSASLSIANTTASGEGLCGVYVYEGSMNVMNCNVSIAAPAYGLHYGSSSSGGGPKAPSRTDGNGPRKVIAPNGPVDATGYLNLYEGATLTLEGGTAALWGAGGYSESDNTYVPGYLEDVGLVDSDKSTYESNPNYSYVEGPLYIPAGQGDFNGSYYFGCLKGENDYDIFAAHYLRFASNVFVATTDEGISMKFKITGENTVQVGNDQGSSIVSVPSDWQGELTVPSTISDGAGKEYQVKAVADKAFYRWGDLRSVTLAEGIEHIGTGSTGWGAFEEDYSLSTIYLPSTTKSLADWSFSSCSSIQEVYLSSTEVPSLGSQPFSCPDATLYVPAGCLETYQNSEWSNYFSNIEEMSGVPLIFKAPTAEGVQLTFKIISSEEGHCTVQTYGYLIEGKENRVVPAISTSYTGPITIPETVTYEGVEYTVTTVGAFSFTTSGITSATLPASVTTIGVFAFAATPLTSVTLLNTDPDATVLSTNPPFVEIPQYCKLFVPEEALTAYQEDDVWPTIFSIIRAIGDQTLDIGDLFTADNGEGVDMTFQITGESTVQTYGLWLEGYAQTAVAHGFEGPLTIPETVSYNGVTYTVTAIGEESFDAWVDEGLDIEPLRITAVTIPKTVTNIGDYAFDASSTLTAMYVYATTPPELGEYSPINVAETAILYVPKGTKAAYDGSGWAQYFGNGERIVEMGGGEVPEGDVNGDNLVTIADVTSLVNIILGKPDAVENSAADINGDGIVTIADVTALVNLILGRKP